MCQKFRSCSLNPTHHLFVFTSVFLARSSNPRAIRLLGGPPPTRKGNVNTVGLRRSDGDEDVGFPRSSHPSNCASGMDERRRARVSRLPSTTMEGGGFPLGTRAPVCLDENAPGRASVFRASLSGKLLRSRRLSRERLLRLVHRSQETKASGAATITGKL